MIAEAKSKARLLAKQRRQGLASSGAPSALIQHFPASRFRGKQIAGYWPLKGEMDIRPLLSALSDLGFAVSLPCITGPSRPLIFRKWGQGDEMRAGHFKVQEPHAHQEEITPEFVLMPLLAFTADGKRLGYGGGYYDRTLAKLRAEGDVFACGVAYAGQEVPELPTDEHDQPLDGILTEQFFRTFA
ncbi:5-formyltetrahydrofolate cyclo-ligase [Litorimonas sp.]|uniref:5-formyltetrahydrofolate cyclo-ligase n=1 Tax=Litorimonas sp. TaxID=1892381 RepID=UPI003A88A9B9